MSRSRVAIAAGVVVVALAGAYVGGSWYAGREAQSRIEQFVEQINLDLAKQWLVTERQPVLQIEEYQRGWFSSRIQYSLSQQDERGGAHRFRFHDDLAHGPLPWAALREGDWRPAMAYSRLTPDRDDVSRDWFEGISRAWFDGVEGGAAPLTINTRIAFDGSVHSIWNLSAAQVRGEEAQLAFSAGRMTVDYDPSARTSEVQGELDNLTLVTPETGERLLLEGLTIQGKRAPSGEDAENMRHRLRIRQVSFAQSEQPMFGAQDVEVGLDAVRAGALVDGQLVYTFDRFQIEERDMGRLALEASVKRLDAQAFQSLQQSLEQMAMVDDLADLSDAEQAALRERLQSVLAAGPTVAIDALRWSNAEGQSQASLAVDLAAPDAGDAGEDAGALMARAIRQVRLNVDVPKVMLIETARQMNPDDPDREAAMMSMMFDGLSNQLVREGLIRVEDGAARLDLVYGDEQVTLNGQAMPMADFIALVSPLFIPFF
uniref:YdgA family protein n=1 Tax=Castellaniella defragrans TaxID=75697 RepID=UPI0033425887